MGRLSEWTPATSIRWESVHQLAAVLGFLRRQRNRKHGPSDRVRHEGVRPATATLCLYVWGSILGERRARGARYHRGYARFSERSGGYVAIDVQQKKLRNG